MHGCHGVCGVLDGTAGAPRELALHATEGAVPASLAEEVTGACPSPVALGEAVVHVRLT